jgi:predicted neuraminidase
MPIFRTSTRLLIAAGLVVCVLAIDLAQRVLVKPATATMPALVPQGTALTALRTGGGFIPMPPDAAAAHASNLLAMPASSGAALTAFWFAGDRESAPNVQIVAAQFDRVTQQWLAPKYVVNRHTMGAHLGAGIRRIGNPVAWTDGAGRMHLFVVATGLGGWAAGRILHTVQSSAGQGLAELEFAPLRTLPLSWLWNTSYLVRSAPLPLQDGGMVLPAYFELGIKFPVALRFDSAGNFVGMERMSQRKFLLQPTLIATGPGDWLALLRDNRRDGRVAVARTSDAGAHWRDADSLPLVNPDAAIAGLTLSPMHQVLAHNASPHSRALLDLSGSADGLNWSRLAVLEQGTDADEYSYPALAWADGSLWVSYTDHRTRIAWQRFQLGGAGPQGKP